VKLGHTLVLNLPCLSYSLHVPSRVKRKPNHTLLVGVIGVVALSRLCLKAWVCGRLLAGIAGSNPSGGIDVFLL